MKIDFELINMSIKNYNFITMKPLVDLHFEKLPRRDLDLRGPVKEEGSGSKYAMSDGTSSSLRTLRPVDELRSGVIRLRGDGRGD